MTREMTSEQPRNETMLARTVRLRHTVRCRFVTGAPRNFP
jgi:hypothetical protein